MHEIEDENIVFRAGDIGDKLNLVVAPSERKRVGVLVEHTTKL